MGKLPIANDNHNISNFFNSNSWKIECLLKEEKNKNQGWIWTVSNRVTYIPFMLAYMIIF